jgi:ferredoxin-NADP reductase/ferredoxin
MPTIELTTRDGEHVTFAAEPTETLLNAAARANIFLPAVCREGGCGSCRVTRKTGEIEFGPYSKAALSDAERAAGDILLCRAQARTDLQLKAPFDRAAIGFMAIPERKAAVAELSSAGSSAVRLLLRLEDDPTWGQAAEFIPGQFMELTIPRTSIRRAYSLANTPNWDGTLEFLIRLQPSGAFSSYLADRAKIGDMLVVCGPQGSFTVDEASQAPRWFIAGGTGLAPMLAILRQMAEFGDPRDCRLFFGVNREDELFAAEAVDALKSALPQLKVIPCVWKPGPSWTGFAGTPADALAPALAGPGALPDLYVCGPPALIEAAKAVALKSGIAHDRVFSEQFLPA